MLHTGINILSIAGSDCSANSGIQADIKIAQKYQIHCFTIPTCIVAETEKKVIGLESLSLDIIEKQVHLLLESYSIKMIKIGLIPNAEMIDIISDLMEEVKIPLVIDPVLNISAGFFSHTQKAIHSYEQFFKKCKNIALITPNLPEGEKLMQTSSQTPQERENLLLAFSKKYQVPILLKAGHFNDENQGIDLLCEKGKITIFPPQRKWKNSPHGTGCRLSTAITCLLAQGKELPEAIKQAKEIR